MSIGATLAAARRRAGLTVSDVSQRTRVTEPIIRGIEQDDYAACGGDFYARGHIRAIASAVGEDPLPLIDEYDSTWRSDQEITAAEALQPGLPIRKRERRRVRWTAFLGVLVLALLGFASYKFVSGVDRAHRTSAASPGPSGRAVRPACRRPALRPSRPARRRPAPGPASPSATPSAPSASAVAAQALAPASVAAFGPAGTADGDNPQLAPLAVGRNPARPWYSQWYATAEFGQLKAGTGLLLDMGHPVTVSSVRLAGQPFGCRPSAAGREQARLGVAARVASASNAGGAVRMQLTAPVHARYVLIWFTKLPPDAAGTYQASVYKISVRGQP